MRVKHRKTKGKVHKDYLELIKDRASVTIKKGLPNESKL